MMYLHSMPPLPQVERVKIRRYHFAHLCAQGAANAEEAQTIAHEVRAAAALLEAEPLKRADMEKRRSAQIRTACDELICAIRRKWRAAKEEQIDAAALELAECLGGDLAFLTPEQRRRVAQ
jgi:hypothetical protein